MCPPVLKRATVSTAGSVGAVSRLIRACSPTTVSAAAITASAVSCGMDAWPPRPLTVQSNVSRAARMVPACLKEQHITVDHTSMLDNVMVSMRVVNTENDLST